MVYKKKSITKIKLRTSAGKYTITKEVDDKIFLKIYLFEGMEYQKRVHIVPNVNSFITEKNY